jgi:GNAT superfamily N-acetyltransferase
MDLRPLVEVDLREALGPVNRSQAGQGGLFVPATRTAALLREWVSYGLLDLKLSRACFVGDALVASCLVERLLQRAHLEAIGVEPLAQQRGAGRALLEAVCSAAAAAGVREVSTFASDLDSPLLAILQALGFSRRRTVVRYTLLGAPAPLPQPLELDASLPPDGLTEPTVRRLELAEVLPLLEAAARPPRLFAEQAGVLRLLSPKLTAFGLFLPSQPLPQAVAVCERERRLLVALGGESTQLAPLLCLLAARHGIACLDALVDGDPTESALQAAGFARVALRAEWVKDLG